jgi:hypothetical protein
MPIMVVEAEHSGSQMLEVPLERQEAEDRYGSS